MRVQDVMDQNHTSIYSDELATKAIAILRDLKLRILPAVDEHKRLIGAISRNDAMTIISSVSPVHVKGIMSLPPLTATMDVDAVQAVRQMLHLDEWHIPVVKSPQDNTYVGVLGLDHPVRKFVEKNVAGFSTPMSNVMSSENLFLCSSDDESDNIWQRMKQRSFAACPVVVIATQQNLLESGAIFPAFEAQKGRFKAPTKIFSLMKTPVVLLKLTNTIGDAAKLMLKKTSVGCP